MQATNGQLHWYEHEWKMLHRSYLCCTCSQPDFEGRPMQLIPLLIYSTLGDPISEEVFIPAVLAMVGAVMFSAVLAFGVPDPTILAVD